MNVTVVPAVRQSISVDVPVERAFDVFTRGFASWWPLDSHHIGQKDATDAVMEPRVGGRWFERAADGTECEWGRVLAWEPPHRVVLGWQLSADWVYDPDPAHGTEIEVTFTADGDGTRVELEHRNLDRYGDRAEEVRTAVSSEGGWPGLLALFKASVEA
jgi:uncharacterized protein YndB with AHSA1/START domain